jgi:hypothetical protein
LDPFRRNGCQKLGHGGIFSAGSAASHDDLPALAQRLFFDAYFEKNLLALFGEPKEFDVERMVLDGFNGKPSAEQGSEAEQKVGRSQELACLGRQGIGMERMVETIGFMPELYLHGPAKPILESDERLVGSHRPSCSKVKDVSGEGDWFSDSKRHPMKSNEGAIQARSEK